MSAAPEGFDRGAPLNAVEPTARWMGISRGLCYKLARSGELPAIRIGGRLMIKTAPLLALVGSDAAGDADE